MKKLIVIAALATGCGKSLPAVVSPKNAAIAAEYEIGLRACQKLGEEQRDYDAFASCVHDLNAKTCREHGYRCSAGGGS